MNAEAGRMPDTTLFLSKKACHMADFFARLRPVVPASLYFRTLFRLHLTHRPTLSLRRFRKVTICTRVQSPLGSKVVALVPRVMLLSTAHCMASA